MKKVLSILLCFVLLLSLCACGGKEEPAAPIQDTPAAAPTEAPTDAPAQEATEAPTEEEAADVPAEPAEEDVDPVAAARGLIDQPIEDLYALIGEPESADYAPSCMGDGEDGMLFYDGFVVYTYREGDVETVYDVE